MTKLVTIREGVSFQEPAALSFQRIERQLGTRLDVNRSTVPYDEQKQLYEEWLAGMRPDIPLVLNPEYSVHVYREGDSKSALAVDSDSYGPFWHDNGWYEVNSQEPWHREYQQNRDNHINDPKPEETIEEEDEDMTPRQIHYTEKGETTRALIVPGTAYFMPWTESGATYANGIAKNMETGSSTEVTKSLFNAFMAAAERCATLDVKGEIQTAAT